MKNSGKKRGASLMNRADGRLANQLRKIKITKNYTKYAEGCCLVEFGDTRVLCTASVEENVPPFLRGSGTGWVTAEYGMLPRSSTTRIPRERGSASGRSQEIQRLIGRSLRSIVNLEKLGERTIKVDCDVIQADGGTRTASITGSFIALAEALMKLKESKTIPVVPVKDYVAAVSVGIFNGQMLLDLNYQEDSKAEMDMNIVMVSKGGFVEIQGTAEKNFFTKNQNDALLSLAQKGIRQLFSIQKKNLSGLKLLKS